MDQNPVPPCLLFALLFELFALSGRMALVETQFSGKMDQKTYLVFHNKCDARELDLNNLQKKSGVRKGPYLSPHRRNFLPLFEGCQKYC